MSIPPSTRPVTAAVKPVLDRTRESAIRIGFDSEAAVSRDASFLIFLAFFFPEYMSSETEILTMGRLSSGSVLAATRDTNLNLLLGGAGEPPALNSLLSVALFT